MGQILFPRRRSQFPARRSSGKVEELQESLFMVGRDLAKNVVVEKFINLFDLNDR